MDVVRIRTKTDAFGRAHFTVATAVKESDIEVVVGVSHVKAEEKGRPDLAQFFGKLKWKGDALAEQRALRSEW